MPRRLIALSIFLLHATLCYTSCPSGFVATKNKDACYRFFSNPMNRDQARALCASHNSKVPMFRSIQDVKNMRAVLTNAPGYFFIGANALSTKGTWVLDDPDDCLYWMPWGQQQPDNGPEKCAVYYNEIDVVHDYQCSDVFSVVCQARFFPCEPCFKATARPEITGSTDTSCPSGFVATKNNVACYRLFSKPRNRDQARALCANHNSKLPMFRSIQDVKNMRAVLANIPFRFFIGANALSKKDTWVFDDPDDCQYWMPWGKKQPENGPEKCAVYYSTTNNSYPEIDVVHDYKCTRVFPVICQARFFPCEQGFKATARPRIPGNTDTSCPSGFVATKNKDACYRLFSKPMNRDQARALCANHNSKVPMFRNIQDVKNMRAVLTNIPGWFFIGANALSKKDTWVFDDPDDCQYWMPWGKKQPENGPEKCAVYYSSTNNSYHEIDVIHDYNCTRVFPVICQARFFPCEQGFKQLFPCRVNLPFHMELQ